MFSRFSVIDFESFSSVIAANLDSWRATIQHVKQYKQHSDSSSYIVNMETCSSDEGKALDELSVIMNIYAERLTKARSGKKIFDDVQRVVNNLFHYSFFFPSNATDAFILSRSEADLNEIYQILMENLYFVTAAIQELDINLKTNSSPSVRSGDIVDIITTL